MPEPASGRHLRSSPLLWVVVLALPLLVFLGSGFLWFVWAWALFQMSVHYVGLKDRLRRAPTAGPCRECGQRVGLFWGSEREWEVSSLATESDRPSVLAVRICAACARGVRRWRCEDCGGEVSGRASGIRWKRRAPSCTHCGGRVVRLMPVPEDLLDQPDAVRAWRTGAARTGAGADPEAARRVAALIADRDGHRVQHVGGLSLPAKLDALLFATRDGLVLAKRTMGGRPDAAISAVIPWDEVADIESETFREGSDATKINAWMTAMRPGSGGLGATIGALSLITPGEHTVYLVAISRRLSTGVEVRVCLKVADAAMASTISSERARFAAIAAREA